VAEHQPGEDDVGHLDLERRSVPNPELDVAEALCSCVLPCELDDASVLIDGHHDARWPDLPGQLPGDVSAPAPQVDAPASSWDPHSGEQGRRRRAQGVGEDIEPRLAFVATPDA
jgi:hypothetical protein